MSANPQTSETGFRPNLGRVKIGAVLVAVGGLLAAVGSGIAGIEFALATRRWVSEQNQNAAAVALGRVRRALEASQAATHAAAETWQSGEERVNIAS